MGIEPKGVWASWVGRLNEGAAVVAGGWRGATVVAGRLRGATAVVGRWRGAPVARRRRRGAAAVGRREGGPATTGRHPPGSVRALLALAVLSSLAEAGVLSAQEPSVAFHGQVRPRMETRGLVDGAPDTFTSMRVRAALSASLESNLSIFLQLQDVRLFGEEANTLGDYRADNFDLHQGYLQVAHLPWLDGSLRVGRQEVNLGEQRLVGAVGWTQQGRSLDGIRVSGRADRFGLDLLAMQTQESGALAHDHDATFLGAYGTIQLEQAGDLDLFAFLNQPSNGSGSEEVTLGAMWARSAGPISLRMEGSIQTGERGGVDVSASMFGARGTAAVGDRGSVTLWFDQLSGDDDPDDGEVGVFNTLLATNHAFYGFYDLFLDIPAHTGGLGLRDAALKGSLNLGAATVVRADVHHFRSAVKGPLSTAALANELDLTLRHQIGGSLTLQAGYSYVEALDGIQELGRLTDNAHWGYLMLDAGF